jgi:hypothetical protein
MRDRAGIVMASTVRTWRYHLTGDGWCIAFIDEIGCLSVLSDYGNYGHRWPDECSPKNHTKPMYGGDFRRFLVQCEAEYVLRKIAPRDEYDGHETYKAVKEAILRGRREGCWSRKRARVEWDMLEDYERLDCRENFARWYDHTAIDDAYEFAVYAAPLQAKAFMQRVWPRLVSAMRADLELEEVRP